MWRCESTGLPAVEPTVLQMLGRRPVSELRTAQGAGTSGHPSQASPLPETPEPLFVANLTEAGLATTLPRCRICNPAQSMRAESRVRWAADLFGWRSGSGAVGRRRGGAERRMVWRGERSSSLAIPPARRLVDLASCPSVG